MVEYFKNEAENLMNDYNGLINGLFVRNPGTKGYTVRVSLLKLLLYFDNSKMDHNFPQPPYKQSHGTILFLKMFDQWVF